VLDDSKSERRHYVVMLWVIECHCATVIDIISVQQARISDHGVAGIFPVSETIISCEGRQKISVLLWMSIG
jgi:hypothetical protein